MLFVLCINSITVDQGLAWLPVFYSQDFHTFCSNAIERLQIQTKQHAKLQNMLIGFALLKLSLCA